MSEVITYQVACRKGRCEGFLCKCVAQQLADASNELRELRSILTRLGVRKEADGTWTMPCDDTETCDWADTVDGHPVFHCPHCKCKGSRRIPVPLAAPLTDKEEPR